MGITKQLRIKHLIALFSIIGFFYACEVPNINDFEDLPKITTSEVSEITALSAISGGVITDDGGYDVTARGVCWDTVPNPTIKSNKTIDAAGTGAFQSSLKDLAPNTLYYVRSYATNQKGTAYGLQIFFSTESGESILTTKIVESITATSSISGGNITFDGGADIILRGVCWSTNPNPTIDNDKTDDGSGSGDFTSEITNLEPETNYYVRAYATNSVGTSYGDEISFTTKCFITDIDGNTYLGVTLGEQTWMAENLKTTKYNDGTAIPYVSGNYQWSNNLSTSAYCYYDGYNTSNKDTYGALYNWYAVNTGKLCPEGWHVPADAEWTELENYLADNGYNYDGSIGGGRDKVAKAMASESGWYNSTNTGAVGNNDYPEYRNKSGFSALPGGARDFNGTFLVVGYVEFY